MLTGANCNGICQCAEGLTYVRGRCRQLVNLNEPCRDEIDCFFGYNRDSVECRDGKCQCAEGFYQRFTNVCRRESLNGEPCIVNADCVETDSSCNNYVCTTSVGTQTLSLRNAGVQTSPSLDSLTDSLPELEKSNYFPYKRNIRSYFKYTKLENVDDTGKKFSSIDDESTQFGDSCESENKPCTGLKYSMCRRGFCQCQDRFYHKDGICKAELGEHVDANTYCGSGTFRNNKCVCRNDEFYQPNMRSCIKSASGINTSCTQPSQCTPYGAAFCPTLQPRRCQCYDYARYNAATELCELKEGLGEYCETNKNCKVENTVCTTKNTCECKQNFVAQNESECKPSFGAECEVTEDCAFENAECKLEVVDEITSTVTSTIEKYQCKEDFVGVGEKCLEKAKSYNDTCTENDQCKPLLGDKATCNESKCNCDESLHLKNGQCNDKKELNEVCSKSTECFFPNDPEAVECRNGVCKCKFDYSPDSNQNRCVRPRDKNSSKSTSPLKVVTLMLIASAVVITGSALRDAYYP
ncbi:CLUMA_CG016428, isoform A [Clunio marinus]|uniref:CLUMA_CG016428, isoform A n=1 Tax=Clunio marinus TaxID=568069 RepID=A0A1J1ITI1_9DIPT|nr:CLUMA_CG016428, isoform A [Clunio marinus]